MTVPDLTVKERIQLHLFNYTRFADAYEAPVEVTQGGIAKAVGIRVHHVPQYIRPLVSDGLVEERTSRIQRQPRRRKVYFLSGSGRLQVASLRNSLLREEVPLRMRSGEIERVPLSRVYHEDRRGATLSELLNELRSFGCVSEVAEAAKPGPVDFTQEAPKVDRFYGRERELAEVLRALDVKPLTVVTGMAGMGKTTLGSKVCDAFRGKRHLFWRQVRPWDTAMDIASRLAVFLKSLGRLELHGALVGQESKDVARIEEPLAVDLAGATALLVLDDVHNASHEALVFLSILHLALKHQKGTSALLLSRNVPAFYSRREVAVEGSVVELALKGLDRASSVSLLADSGIADPLVGGLVEACGGNPLFLRLLASSAPRGAPDEGWRTLETYIAEQIEPSLDEAEHACMQVASLYRLPVPVEGLLIESGVQQKTLIGLHRKGLVDRGDSDKFVLHDAIRTYFERGLSSDRRGTLVAKVVPWLMDQAQRAADRGNPDEAIGFFGNAVGIEVDPSRRLSALERLGDARRSLGDYPGAIEAYRTALRQVAGEALRARFHQKIAACFEAQGHLTEANQEIEEGLGLLPQQPSAEAAWLLFRGASVAYSRQDYDKVVEQLEGLTGWMPVLARDPDLWGWVTNLRGLIHLYDPRRADPALAAADFQSAIKAFESCGDQPGLCLGYNNLGLAALELGQLDNGLAHLDRSAAVAQAIGDLPARGTALFTKAWCLSEFLGDYDAAEALYRETYRLAKETHRRQKVIWHYNHLAILYRRQGRYEEAREALEYFLAASGDMLNAENRVADLSMMARICLECGDPDAADAQVREAETLLRQSPSDHAAYCIEWAKGAVQAYRGASEAADENFRRAFDLPNPWDRGEFLLDYGRFLASRGETERAKDVLHRACDTLAGTSKPLERAARETLRSIEATADRHPSA